MKTIFIFEDVKYWQFLPLTYTRPVYDLRCGIKLIREKIASQFIDAEIKYLCRWEIEKVFGKKHPEFSVNDYNFNDAYFVNGRIIEPKLSDELFNLDTGQFVYNGSTLLMGRLQGKEDLMKLINDDGCVELKNENDLELINKEIPTLNYPWNILHKNGAEITRDYEELITSPQSNIDEDFIGVHFVNKEKIHIGNNAVVKPGTVLDAELGPIFIDDDVKIFPNSVIIGPAYIGKGTQIKSCAKIYNGTSIGEVCKIGGEVGSAIIQSYTNKAHDGFLGNAYLGSWVNLGADTNNSDLKNNYSNVKVKINGRMIDTESLLFGLIMGDHSKTAINTQLNTGTVIGVCSNVFGNGFPPKSIPSFSWGGFDTNYSVHNLDRAMDTAEKVMARRNVTLLQEEKELFKLIHDNRNKEY